MRAFIFSKWFYRNLLILDLALYIIFCLFPPISGSGILVGMVIGMLNFQLIVLNPTQHKIWKEIRFLVVPLLSSIFGSLLIISFCASKLFYSCSINQIRAQIFGISFIQVAESIIFWFGLKCRK